MTNEMTFGYHFEKLTYTIYLFQMYCWPYAEELIEHGKYQETELMASKNKNFVNLYYPVKIFNMACSLWMPVNGISI
jgi:hypothetical protein